MKIYFEQEGIKYYNYDLILDNYNADCIAVDDTTYELLNSNIDTLLDPNITPAINSLIYLAPDCPVAVDDIRKNYTIKRVPDTGDFNIFHPYSRIQGGRRLKEWAIVPSEKKVFAIIDSWTSTKTTLTDLISIHAPHLDWTKISRCVGRMDVRILQKKAEPWFKLLRGEYKKPCVSYKNLQFANTNEMTMDIIDLIYRTGTVTPHYSHEDVDKFILQIKALNQCNWRDYPRALSILFNEIIGRNNVCNRVRASLSTMSKPVKEILGQNFPDHSTSEKDFNMAKAIIDHFLGVENVRFTNASTLLERLSEFDISLKTFSEFYENIIRLTPKKYGE